MPDKIILIIVTIFIGILLCQFLLKKFLGFSYDRRTIFWSTVALAWAFVTSFIIKEGPFELNPEHSIGQKISQFLLLILCANALVQFLAWAMYSFIRHRDIVKAPRFLFNIFSILFVIGAIMFGVKVIFEKDLNALLVTSTLVSAIIGLALQNTLSNLFAGFALQIEQPFSIDDWVNLGGHEGKVVSQNWRSVTLLTRENHRVSLTNNFVAEDKVINFSRPTRKQVHNFYISLDYSHPPNKIKKILEDLMNEIDEVDLDTTHGAFVVDYLDSGIKYCLKYWLHDYADIIQLEDIVLTRLWYKLERHNIKIPYPISEVKHIQLENDGGEKADIQDEKIIAFLEKLDWIKSMNPDNIKKFYDNGEMILYAKDDLIVRQEDPGDSMFVIIEGSARVLLKTDHHLETILAHKEEGEFFGEMSLLTGKPRSASVRANKDSLVLRIDQDSFSKIISEDEGVLYEFVDALSKSESGIADAIANAKSNKGSTRESAVKVVMSRIWNYLKNPNV